MCLHVASLPQAIEQRHLSRQQRGSEVESSDEDSDGDLDLDVTGSMNRSMTNLYTNNEAAAPGADKPNEGSAAVPESNKMEDEAPASGGANDAVDGGRLSQPSASGRTTKGATPGVKRTGAGRSERY